MFKAAKVLRDFHKDSLSTYLVSPTASFFNVLSVKTSYKGIHRNVSTLVSFPKIHDVKVCWTYFTMLDAAQVLCSTRLLTAELRTASSWVQGPCGADDRMSFPHAKHELSPMSVLFHLILHLLSTV